MQADAGHDICLVNCLLPYPSAPSSPLAHLSKVICTLRPSAGPRVVLQRSCRTRSARATRLPFAQRQQVLVILQALQTLDKVISEKLEDLSEITATPTSQLKFVTDAWSQVVDCRRMLKWTYAFGYYRFADDSAPNKPQQEFFEFNQVGMLQMRVMLQQHVAHCSTFSNARKMTVSQ